MEQHHGAADFFRITTPDGRGGQLDRALTAICPRQQQCAPAQIDRCASGQRLPHRIGQQPPIHFVDEADNLFESFAQRLIADTARHAFCGGVLVGDLAFSVRRDDRFGE